MTSHNTPVSVLVAIARVCECGFEEIEKTLEGINDAAGLAPRPIARMAVAEHRLDEIRRWLGTPEAAGVIEQASDYVRRMSVP